LQWHQAGENRNAVALNVQFVDIGVKLRLTPTIGPDGTVTAPRRIQSSPTGASIRRCVFRIHRRSWSVDYCVM
jgi:hypothetical protein